MVQPALGLAPKVMAGSSAGAAIASLIVMGRGLDALESFKRATGANERNFYWSRLFTRGQSALPHAEMYRQAIVEQCLPEAVARLRTGPEVRVMLARPPRWSGVAVGAFVGLMAYELEKRTLNPAHPVSGQRLGFRSAWYTLQSCPDPHSVADLILQSSCVWPFVPVMQRDGTAVLDGGLVENAPLAAIEDVEGAKLVMLSRPYPDKSKPQREDVAYVQPSEKIRVGKFDYTSPDKLQMAYDMGRKDAEDWLRGRE